jgi:hypothetical protein
MHRAASAMSNTKNQYQHKIIVIVIHGALIAFWFLERKKLA